MLEANELFALLPRATRGNPYPQESAQTLEAPDHAHVDGVLDANQIRRGVAKRLLFPPPELPPFEILAEQRVSQFSQTITLTGVLLITDHTDQLRRLAQRWLATQKGRESVDFVRDGEQ